MNILVRCDSSNIIGTGHVMRCLNLCEYYPQNRYTFICRNFNMKYFKNIPENDNAFFPDPAAFANAISTSVVVKNSFLQINFKSRF